jgi:hypothetical protein
MLSGWDGPDLLLSRPMLLTWKLIDHLIFTILSFLQMGESNNCKAFSGFRFSASLRPVEDPDVFGGE